MKKAEDPEMGINHVGAGKMWDKFVKLCSSVWVTGTIPQQMCWVVTVLIPKGGGISRHWAPQTNLEGSGAGNGHSAGEH